MMNRFVVTVLLFIAFGCGPELLFCPPSSADNLVFIVHAENSESLLIHSDIRQIFLSRKTHWDAGPKIDVVLNENPLLAKEFYKGVIRKTADQYLVYRKKLLFNGITIPPKTFSTDAEVVSFVKKHRYSIGFVSASSVEGPDKSPGIKSLSIHQ